MAEFYKIASNNSLNVALNYDKANLAIQLVNEFDSSILRNVSTVIPLSGNAYGVYMNSDNLKQMPEDIRMIFRGSMDDNQINMTPKATLIDYLQRYQGRPGFEDYDFSNAQNSIEVSDTIRINVDKILREIDSSYLQVIEVASTIIHEATHVNESEENLNDTEAAPEANERAFSNAITSGSVGRNTLLDVMDIDDYGQEMRRVL